MEYNFDKKFMQKQLLVEIEYWANGREVFSVVSEVYPQYRVGEAIELRLIPTNRERTRRPAQKWSVHTYIVTKVHHIVEEIDRDTNSYSLHLQVLMRDAAEPAEED